MIEWLLNAALASRDSPLNSWRMEHAFTEACRWRRCSMESCARREAICRYEAWAGRILRGEPEGW